MSDLLWDDVKDWFDPETYGTLPDVCVPETDVADWQATIDLVRSRGWAYEYTEDSKAVRLPGSVETMFARAATVSLRLTVWPAQGMAINFWPYSADEILFDIDIREIQCQERLDALCAFLRSIGRRLGKPVLMSPEGFDVEADSDFGYQVDVDRVVDLRSDGVARQ
jgi:hypothetical protein